MIERKSVLVSLAFLALLFVCVPSVLFNNAIRKYFSFMGHWSIASVPPSHNAQIPPMHPRFPGRRPDPAQPELRFVKFTVKIANAKSVNVAGDFNRWNQDSIALVKRAKNTWGTIIALPPGVYQYLYKIDGQIILDPLNPDTAMLGGKKVSVMTVK
jgi:hypothetical protein